MFSEVQVHSATREIVTVDLLVSTCRQRPWIIDLLVVSTCRQRPWIIDLLVVSTCRQRPWIIDLLVCLLVGGDHAAQCPEGGGEC